MVKSQQVDLNSWSAVQFISIHLFSHFIKQHREIYKTDKIIQKAKVYIYIYIYCTHQTGELALLIIILINLHKLIITANFFNENNF